MLAERAKGIANLKRLTIASALAQTDELCVCDIAWVCERPENLVSHHLHPLSRAGLVAGRRDGKMVIYTVTHSGRSLLAAVHANAQPAR